jgi:hypothetical protein
MEERGLKTHLSQTKEINALGGICMKSQVEIILLLLALGSAVVAQGCQGHTAIVETHPDYEYGKPGPPPWAPAHGYRAKYHYYYYPESQVYFEVGRGFYFYYDDGQWRVVASLPAGIYIDVHDYVELDMDTDRPYVFHSEVVKRYPPGQAKKRGKWKYK